MSKSYRGKGFVLNGQVPQADGTFLRYSVRRQNHEGRKGKTSSAGSRSQIKARRDASIRAVFGALSVADVDHEVDDE